MRCFRRLLGISYRDHVTNEEVGNRIRQAIGPYEDLLTTVKKHKLRWYGHKTRSTGIAKMILQGTAQGGRRRGRQKKRWEDNVTEWTGLQLGEALRKAENREEWRTVVARSSLGSQRSTRLWDKWSEVKWHYCCDNKMFQFSGFGSRRHWSAWKDQYEFTPSLSSLPRSSINVRLVKHRSLWISEGGTQSTSLLCPSVLQAIKAVILWFVHVLKVPSDSWCFWLTMLLSSRNVCCICSSMCPFDSLSLQYRQRSRPTVVFTDAWPVIAARPRLNFLPHLFKHESLVTSYAKNVDSVEVTSPSFQHLAIKISLQMDLYYLLGGIKTVAYANNLDLHH